MNSNAPLMGLAGLYSNTPQQDMPMATPIIDPLQQAAQQYQALQAIGRPDLAQQVLQQSSLPAPTMMDQIKSVFMGTPNSGLSGGAQLAQMVLPHLFDLYKNYMAQQQWGQNPQLMAGNANSQIANMQNSFGLKR